MSKGKGAAAKPSTEKAESNERTVYFVPQKVTKGAIRFVEATATGKSKTQSKSVWRTLYGRLFDAEGGLEDYLDDDGDCTISRVKVTITIE